MDEEELYQGMNSELRFITLELMKLAQKRDISFEKIAEEYVKNVNLMQKKIGESLDKNQNESPESNF
ncbi:MAG: hypothetical protein WC501_03655 [Candidatus Micrarchaeia archaeon]|jgi:hypothetical protein